MRCPFCGAFNRDNATYCTHCGRDLNVAPAPPARSPQPPQPQRPPYQQPQRPAYAPPSRPAQTPPQRPQYTPPQRPAQPQPPQPVQATPKAAPNSQRRRSGISQPEQPLMAPVVPEPEAPGPFPPRTMEHVQALMPGAQSYTLLSDDPREGRKRLVRISYPPCANWQQVATLFKALQEYRSDKFVSIIIQGNRAGTNDPNSYNNGQLVFDRRVLLGSDMLNRYQIETGTGLDSTAVRIVLSEKC